MDFQSPIRKRYQTEKNAMVHNNIREYVDAVKKRSQVMVERQMKNRTEKRLLDEK